MLPTSERISVCAQTKASRAVFYMCATDVNGVFPSTPKTERSVKPPHTVLHIAKHFFKHIHFAFTLQ